MSGSKLRIWGKFGEGKFGEVPSQQGKGEEPSSVSRDMTCNARPDCNYSSRLSRLQQLAMARPAGFSRSCIENRKLQLRVEPLSSWLPKRYHEERDETPCLNGLKPDLPALAEASTS